MWLRLLPIAAVMMAASSGWADTWPTGRTITLVNPLTAGSATDIIARTIFEHVDRQMGSTTIVESRPGGGGTVAAAYVAKAAPDGFTVLFTSSAFTITAVTSTISFDPVKSFAPVALVATQPNVLAAASDKGWRTVKDLVDAAKAKPGQLNYATVGPASAAHFNAERFSLAAGMKAQPVPFRGPVEGLTEVMAGRVDFHFVPLLPALPLIRDGKVRALAVSSPRRAAAIPEVPTTVEAGYPGSEYVFWFGALLPANTPRPIVERLSQEIRKALEIPAVKERLAQMSAEPAPSSPDEFTALLQKELEENAHLVRAAGIKAN
jgi:tripartite-type tricarboxylate transporter receptor subunit TctC